MPSDEADAPPHGGIGALQSTADPCDECGHGLSQIEYDGQVEKRCATNSCPVGWVSQYNG